MTDRFAAQVTREGRFSASWETGDLSVTIRRRRFVVPAVIFVLLAAAALQLGYGVLDRAPDLDEAFYLDLARGISRSGIPAARPTEGPFLAHPVLFYYLESLLFLLGEPPLILARSLSSVISLCTLWTFHGLVWRLWGQRRALTATALLAINPCFVYYSHSVYMEATVSCFAVLTLALWLRGCFEGKQHAVVAGISGGLAIVTKYLGGLYVAAIAAAWLHSRERRGLARARLLFITSAAVVAGTWPLYGLALSPAGFLEGLRFWLAPVPDVEAASSWRVAGLARFLTYAVGVLTPALVTVSTLGIGMALVDERQRAASAPGPRSEAVAVASWTVGLFVLFYSFTSRRDVKYLAVILPVVALFATWPIDRCLAWARTRVRKVCLAGIAILLLSPMTCLYDPIQRTWRPNIVIFSILRDDRYADLAKLGRTIRTVRVPGQRAIAEAKNSLIAYYGDLETDGVWGMPWTAIEERLSRSDFYVSSSDATYLSAADRRRRDELLRRDFEPMGSLEAD